MLRKRFDYTPICSAAGCGAEAIYKIAAPWSDGKSRELKNYGLACESHRDSQLARGKIHREGLRLAEGESVGPTGVYRLEPGAIDAKLSRMPDHDA